MISRRTSALIIFFIFIVFNSLTAAEARDGYIRLLINEKNGNFSFYYLTDPPCKNYEALFNHREQSASFLTVNVNGKVYQLGKSRVFRTRIEKINGSPAIIYESPFLLVSKIFSPVKTTSSPVTNGIKITVIIENKSGKEIPVGLRMLIDTHLGEGSGRIPFVTDNLEITGEKIIEASSGENYWITRGERISLMGNITNPVNDSSKNPNFLHFANWKKLNDVPWKAAYNEGRSFDLIPYSIGDSAVCYYYEPEMLADGEIFTYTIFLTSEDTAWYIGPQAVLETPKTETPINITAIDEAVIEKAAENYKDIDILTLRKFQKTIEQFIAGEIFLNEQDLLEIEMSISRFKNKR